MAPARDPSPVSEELIRTEQWIQDTPGVLTLSPHANGFWSNSNVTGAQQAGDAREHPIRLVVPKAKTSMPSITGSQSTEGFRKAHESATIDTVHAK